MSKVNLLDANQFQKPDVWYKEPWLLLVVGGPLAVVIAAVFTGYIAFTRADDIVAEDYYRQGLMVNKDIQRDARARTLKLVAQMSMNQSSKLLKIDLKGQQLDYPEVLQVSLAVAPHSARSVNEVVRRLKLQHQGQGVYEAEFDLAAHLDKFSVKLTHIKIETNEWRLTGDWFDPKQNTVQLTAAK